MSRNLFTTVIKFSLATTLRTFLIILSIFSIAGFFSRYNELCELMSHLRLAYCFASFILCLLMIFARTRITVLACLALLILNLVPVLALYAPLSNKSFSVPKIQQQNPSPLQYHAPNEPIRFLQMNLWGGQNTDHATTLKLIENTKPDLIAFSEVTGTWAEVLKNDLPEYHYQAIEPRFGGIALLSKFPFVSAEIRYSGKKHRPRVVVRVRIRDRIVTIISAHPLIPIHTFSMRNDELSEIANESKNSKGPVILVGDLNCTPWSHYFDKLKRDGNLIDSEQGFGPQPSWNVITPVMPIDHCLTSPDFVTINRYVCQGIGSDHFPVFVELKMSDRN